MQTTFIYALNDPNTGLTRYIGKADDPQQRLSVHLASKEQNHRTNWIKSLLKNGQQPVLEILDAVPKEFWPQWEVAWIANFRELGYPLVNGTVGGEGSLGPTPETIAKRVKARKGFKHSKESRTQTQESVKAYWTNLGEQEKQARLQKCKLSGFQAGGRKETPEQLESRRIFSTGRKTPKSPSRFIGVFRYDSRTNPKKWRALIYVNRQQIHLGLFLNELDAALAYDKAAQLYFGSKSKLNFP